MEYLKLPSVSWTEAGFSLSTQEEETNEQHEKDWGEEMEEWIGSIFPACTYQTRITGCLACLGIGFLIQMGSTVRLFSLLKGDPKPFAIMYTSGNIVSICATLFFYGPWSQCKRMFESTRIAATLMYLGFMVTTLFLAYYPETIPGRIPLIVLSILCQFIALVWYTLSYIPYGRSIALSCFKGMFPGASSMMTCGCTDEEAAQTSSWLG